MRKFAFDANGGNCTIVTGSFVGGACEEFRLAVILADLEDFSYREIAEIVDRPIGTVMSQVGAHARVASGPAPGARRGSQLACAERAGRADVLDPPCAGPFESRADTSDRCRRMGASRLGRMAPHVRWHEFCSRVRI